MVVRGRFGKEAGRARPVPLAGGHPLLLGVFCGSVSPWGMVADIALDMGIGR